MGTNPMRYEYWQDRRCSAYTIVPVALYGERILGAGDPGYYGDMPADPGKCVVYFGRDGEERVAELERDREHYKFYPYPGTDQEPWTPIPWAAPTLAEALAHMGAVHDRHQGQWGKRAHQLNVDLALEDLEDWIGAIAEATKPPTPTPATWEDALAFVHRAIETARDGTEDDQREAAEWRLALNSIAQRAGWESPYNYGNRISLERAKEGAGANGTV